MTLNYYLKKCLWSLTGCGYFVYLILNDLHDGLIFPSYQPYIPYVAAYLVISAVVYPFSFYVSEKLAMMVMKKETWEYYFAFNGPSRNFFIFTYFLCVLFSIPLLMLYPLVNKKR